ncbi:MULTISPECIES: hypothetical protein [Streptococcus]|uniref:hypothetical protein n=1 Tax=Streptococcus TaxID=1301 RepID=UPI0005CE7FEF|nr:MULTISPECIES: hypothetical protein [Streptococcus]MCK4074349.1 hypothetical protein [Streptococcus suis]NQO93949.1 hypothetical protein [Streptococcus suis]NQP15677.1 hypothetical protein [Streptococcus suis]CYU64215.1 Uncharacterised protein [Streptococcus suis]BDD41360.1 hypothetical protein GUT184_16240 [Streptococcus ruminantium]
MIEYEALVIESFKDEVVNQYIKEHFVEILNKQFNEDNLNPEEFIEKYFNYDNFNVKKLERWRKGETKKLKERFIKDFREMPALEKIFLSDFYRKFYKEQVSNQERHFQLKMGKHLSELGLLTIVSNAVDDFYLHQKSKKNTSVRDKIEILKKELDNAYMDYCDNTE